MNINISPECIGCGACEKLCPGAFELVDGQSSPRSPIDAAEDDVLDVADRCPQSAISVEATQEPPSLIEVLQRAEEAGINGASEYLDRAAADLDDKPLIETMGDGPGCDGSGEPSSSPVEKGRSESESKGQGRQLFIQIAIVATIVLVSGYITMS